MIRAAARIVAAGQISRWTEAGVEAAGNSQATATALGSAYLNHVITEAELGQGVRLPSATFTGSRTIFNLTDVQVYVYPEDDDAIQPFASDVPLADAVGVLVDARSPARFHSVGNGVWLQETPPPPPSVVTPLYYEDGLLKIDTDAIGADLFGALPTSGELGEGMTFTVNGSPGDWDTSVFTLAGSYYLIGDVLGFVLRVTGTPSFSTSSGELKVTGFPAAAATNEAVSLYQVSGFNWPASARQLHVRFVGTSAFISANREDSTPVSFDESTVTSGVAIGFTISGTVIVANSDLDATGRRRWAIRASDYATPDEAATVAWESGYTLITKDDEAAVLSIDLTAEAEENTPESRHKLLMELIAWHGNCICVGASSIAIEFADDYCTVSAWDALGTGVPVSFIERRNPKLLLRGTGSTTHTITSIAFGVRTGNLYEDNVIGFTPALPAQVVPGYAIGASNVRGDNDAEAVSGAIMVKTVAVDRLSVTFDHLCPRTANLVSPTTIDSTSTFSGVLASRLVIPSFCLGVNTSYDGPTELWTGSNYEGYLNIIGGELQTDHIGVSWVGLSGASMDQDMIYGERSSIVLSTHTALAGAGDKVVRLYGQNNFRATSAFIGGGGTAQQGLSVEAGGRAQVVRSNIGGFFLQAALISDGGHLRSTASIWSSGSVAVECSGPGSTALLLTTRLSCSGTGAYAIFGGNIQIGGTTYPINNGEAFDWNAGSYITGDADATALLTNASVPTGNRLSKGGGWYQSSVKGLVSIGTKVSIPSNGNALFPLSGIGGRIVATSETLPQLGFTLHIDITSPATIFVAEYSGSSIVVGSGQLIAPLNANKATVSVWLDGSTYKLQILNEMSSGRVWYLTEGPGPITLGTAVVS